MARPGSQPVWATNANYVGGPAVGTPSCVAPSTSAQQEGWEPGVEPGAQNQNWYQNLVYQWIAWLAAGVLDGTWQFTGSVTFDVGLTIAANQNITLSGTGLYKRGARERKFMSFGVLGGSAIYTGATSAAPAIKFSANNDWAYCPIVVEQGETITEVGMVVNEDATQTVSVELYKMNSLGGGVVGGSASSSTGALLDQRISVTGLSETVSSGDNTAYCIRLLGTSAATSELVITSLYIVTSI
jgi:hypothetical protein